MNLLTPNSVIVHQELARRRSEFSRVQRPTGGRNTVRAGAAVLGVLIGFTAAEQPRAAEPR